MKKLFEVDYKKIFSPETLAALKGKSGESYREMLGDKDLMSVLMDSQQLMSELVQAEDGYRDELEMVAVQMAKDAYPIIEYANIAIDAKIVDIGAIDSNIGKKQQKPQSSKPEFNTGEEEELKKKRRIINGITQGASIRGAFGFALFKEYLDAINPELFEKYNNILKHSFAIYDDDDAIAMMLAMIAQGRGAQMQGGESEAEYDEEKKQFVIKAQAICFPMLVHEIVKGLYEIVGTEGFGTDKEKNQAIINQVDKLSNEPEDLRYGKFIYDSLEKIYKTSPYTSKSERDSRVRDIFFTMVYKLEDERFFPFIENAINGKLDHSQKKWALDTLKKIDQKLNK